MLKPSKVKTMIQTPTRVKNTPVKVLATCLPNGQKTFLLILLWPKILDNWQHWHQKKCMESSKEGKNY